MIINHKYYKISTKFFFRAHIRKSFSYDVHANVQIICVKSKPKEIKYVSNRRFNFHLKPKLFSFFHNLNSISLSIIDRVDGDGANFPSFK